MVSLKKLFMVLGVTLLVLNLTSISQVESKEPIKRDTSSLVAGTYDDALTDEVGESPQSNDTMIFRYAFVWGTYEHRIKDWLLSFQIWNDDWSNLTIHVIGYWIRESRYVHVEAYFVSALRHIGIIGKHQCCIFAFGLLTVGC